ncbi:MAG: aldo/keto reductase [Candidatus Izemoplasmataceae bacterium]|jgi:diketogulonate reductase-like aldo/keto reductase
MSSLNEFYELNNGIKLPKIGFGTSPLKGDEAYQAVKRALDYGYRHIDTAALYNNEDMIGKAIVDSEIPREDLFLTTKLDASIKNYDDAIEAFNQSLDKLNLNYVDLYLIHAPWPWDDKEGDYRAGNIAVYKALETLYHEGKIKAIGVSNFTKGDLENILANCKVTPAVNQIRYFVGIDQEETISFCQSNSILIEAYSPLGRGEILEHDTLINLSKKYGKTPAQVCLRYLIDQHIAPLPRSKTPLRIKENLELDFSLSKDDIKTLKAIRFDPRK